MLAETNKGQLERQLPHQFKASNARTSLQQTPAEQIQYSVSFHTETEHICLLSIYDWIQHHLIFNIVDCIDTTVLRMRTELTMTSPISPELLYR